MKSSFIKLGLIVTLVGLVPFVSYGASGEATTSEEQTGATQEDSSPLLLESITVQDDMNILVQFNQKIVSEAVRVRITKQSDGSNISVDKVVSVVDTPMSVLVVLSSVLEEGGTYTLTVMSAISESGVVIKEGSDALKEFTTPVPLKRSLVVFNAPPNPNAVVATGVTTTTTEVPTTNTGSAANTPQEPAATATELPLTGMDTTLFLIVAGGLAFLILFRRKA